MEINFTPRGIYLPQIDLRLDPQDRCVNSWFSHGHSDHARGLHRNVTATYASLRIYRFRRPQDVGTPRELQRLDYRQSMDFHGARLTAYPASHIVGAAQLLVEWRGERIVYTGDIKLHPQICESNKEVAPCDRLVCPRHQPVARLRPASSWDTVRRNAAAVNWDPCSMPASMKDCKP